jgi:ATP-binding cassette subfamily C protein CydC
MLAVVGPSGAGKSTLIHLLMRFWEYETGEILIGGHSVRDYEPDVLRSLFAVMPQRPFFFNASVRSNLLLARPDASEVEVLHAAQQAQIHDFITQLPEGYDTYIGEQGLRLSGGERQRLAIARALIKDAPILIFDEPTANLDPLTELRIFETIYGLMRTKTRDGQNRSSILITHRLIGLENMDEIFVMEHGRIVERGTHTELLRNDGLYHRLFTFQNRVVI